MAKSDSTPAAKSSLVFVFLVVLIDMLGFGIIMPVLPDLITEITGDNLSAAAIDAGWLAFAYAAMQFVFGPVVGNLSDRFGRRPVLLGALGGYAIAYVLMGFAPSLLWLFVARIVAGIMGASFSTAYAYIADISPPDRRWADCSANMARACPFLQRVDWPQSTWSSDFLCSAKACRLKSGGPLKSSGPTHWSPCKG